MKKSILLTIIILLIIVIGITVSPKLLHSHKLVHDYEQQGLKNQIVLKFSHVVAENTPKGLAAKKFAELVYKKSNGKIRVEVFPNGMLYSDIEEINALKENKVQIIAPSTSKLGSVSEKWGIFDLPFAFPSYQAVQEGLNGKIGQELLQSLEKDDLKGLAYWINGFKQITSNKGPIRTPADIKGQTFRIMQSKVLAAQFNQLDAHPIQQSFDITFQSLDSKKVDGEENTLSNIYSKKFYNLQKYLTISNHGYLGYVVLMNKSFWNKQTDYTKRILSEAIEEVTNWNQQEAHQMNEKQLELIKKNSSINIHVLTDAEKKEWVKKLDPLYDKLAPTIGYNLIDEIKKLRKKYENTK
ncbi:TRAP transporter substrate-binding protein [Heyndrickxia camelliae]|uniref:C4-dicarboxylate ABC transporter n=1 Tax=Heyndrickxia camelliae TaxID=1707093 RepID=A0A2N3LDU3_9BACI|nr:TRAP transporter substrate-binding protein [Heyndrickxia camelliae]PKR82745.1 C4-dicarboxylate ABC transporter [Heyndrickxia camelliae]